MTPPSHPRTAEFIADQILDVVINRTGFQTDEELQADVTKLIKDIQREAFNRGVEEAAKIVDRHESGIELCAEGVADRIRALKLSDEKREDGR